MNVARLLKSMGATGGAIERTFRAMDIAEQELKRGRDRPGLFALLLPPTGMMSLADDVYRSHCRELIARKRDFDLATDAELLVALVETSQLAPLNQSGMATYGVLATRVLGESVRDILGTDWPKEPWSGSTDELLSEMRRRARVPAREIVLRKERSVLNYGDGVTAVDPRG